MLANHSSAGPYLVRIEIFDIYLGITVHNLIKLRLQSVIKI
jgi:hypothetical protein